MEHKHPRQFASDNYAGCTPEAWTALEDARHDHVPAYGDDACTARATNLIRDVFETDCDVFFVFNGTAANSLSLSALCQSYHSILCAETAHVETDECGAPEFFSNGTKILLLPAALGKVEPPAIERAVLKRTDIHYPKPRAVSITQATELGTVYTPVEVRAVANECRRHDLKLHMDGARFANAVASLGVTPADVTWRAGVDVLSFGGTKMGCGVGEAVVFFRREMAQEFDYRCKQAGQLASKMRFLAAPWVGMLEGGTWLKRAAHANAMAALLEEGVQRIGGVQLLFPRQANAVFAELPERISSRLREQGWRFYTFIGKGGCRLMCAWDTTEQDVRAFLADLELAAREAR
jgi:threonine aldolase